MTQDNFLSTEQSSPTLSSQTTSIQPFWFAACFVGHMDMYSDLETVAEYLEDHQGWFPSCANPMHVEPIDRYGYILNIGRFASLGYEVEPKVGIALDPPVDNLYVMRTVPIPGYKAPGYEVQYKSFMELQPMAVSSLKPAVQKRIAQQSSVSKCLTRISWELDIAVTVEFPGFIRKLPTNLVQSTGDRFLAQIVRQISPRLSYKVQRDFHVSKELPLPDKDSRKLKKIIKESIFAREGGEALDSRISA